MSVCVHNSSFILLQYSDPGPPLYLVSTLSTLPWSKPRERPFTQRRSPSQDSSVFVRVDRGKFLFVWRELE